MDDEAMDPGVEPIRIAQAADRDPRLDEGLLDRVLRDVISRRMSRATS